MATIFEESQKMGNQRYMLAGRTYVASFLGSDTLGKLCYKAAFERGVENAQRKAVIGDGAEWISTIAQEHFPQAVRILDLWHLQRRLWEALSSALPDEQHREDARESIGEQLRSGQVNEALIALEELHSATPSTKLLEFIGYVRNNAQWIGCYEQLKADGYPVGSGAVEKGVDIVINRRFKGRRGMRWRRASANGVVAMRVLELNGDWQSYWTTRKAA